MDEEKMEIYIVYGGINYEGYTALKAFKRLDNAEKFEKELDDYDSKHPNCTNYKDSAAHDLLIEKWEDSHPAKNSIYDSYCIESMRLVD